MVDKIFKNVGEARIGDVYSGLGVSIHDGILEIGEFYQGKLDGKGVQIFSNGEILSGEFNEGVLIKGLVNSDDEWRFG